VRRMKPISPSTRRLAKEIASEISRITVKSKKYDCDHAQWSLKLTNGPCETLMCDTIRRPNANDITVVAELAAIWTGLQQIKGYQWIEINSSNETAAVLNQFLYRTPPTGYEEAYRHFKYFINKHDYVINGHKALPPMVEQILRLNPEMRSRARRASQLVTMGAIRRHPTSGYTCWTKSHPQHPYHIRRNQNSGLWECTCPDEKAPTMTFNAHHQTVEVPVCKHLLAAMMTYRLRQTNKKVLRKAA
ncbi:MAG: hypothetical protein ACPGWR_07915, partial [Ardenticatenaceae bacterium]